MELVDLYSGIGGVSCGAIKAKCKPVLGVDCDDGALRLWRANTKSEGVVATLWTDAIKLPTPHSKLHVHLSPPCQALSNARRDASADDIEDGLSALRHALNFVIANPNRSWSLENVSTPVVRTLLQEYAQRWPDQVAYTILDAVDVGTPTTRKRLIAGPPKLIRKLRATPVCRVSVADAFENASTQLPAQYIKNSTRTRDRRPCVRSVQGPAHTVTASHPLTWCNANGDTIRCLTPKETAIVQGFPSTWLLPRRSRDAIRALGNAVPPPVGEAIMKAACASCGE